MAKFDKDKIHDRNVNAKNTYPNLFQKLTVLEDSKSFVDDKEYKKFVSKNLKNIIDKCSASTKEDAIVESYYNLIENSDYLTIRCLLTFLQKYKLMDFYTYYFPGRIYGSHKKGLTQQDILAAYEKELAYVNEITEDESKNTKITKPTIFERLDKFTTIEERQVHLKELANEYSESLKLTEQENSYYNFIMDKENGLYSILENALIKYDGKNFKVEFDEKVVDFSNIMAFYRKYGIDFKMYQRSDQFISKDYLPNVKTITDIRNLFNYFFMELQQIEYFSKSQEELWEEQNEFVTNNKEWLKERKASR